jgi:predicted transport protein
MSMKAYLDNITAKTGRTPNEIVELVRAEGLLEPGVKPKQVVSWLKDEFGLGHGHAMAIVAVIKQQTTPAVSTDDKVSRHFAGKKAVWRPVYDELVSRVGALGRDTDVDPGKTYLSLRRAGRKFAIVQVTAQRLDLGLKLSKTPPGGRLESAGSWNAMVTHRVRIHAAAELDQEVLGWVEQAYASV